MHFEIPGVGVLTATAAVSVTHAGFLWAADQPAMPALWGL